MAKLFGTSDDDGLNGGNSDDVIIGYDGNDVLSGGNGNDTLIGDGLSATRLTLVSTDGAGIQADGASLNAHISPDGTQVVFESDASNLIAGGDLLGVRDIFAKDLVTGALTLVSSDASGNQSDGDSFDADFSAKGQMVVFTTNADNLFAGDTNSVDDILVKNLQTGAVTLVSSSKSGVQADENSGHASFSADGTKVLFQSDADNLVASDSNASTDIFLKSLKTGTVRLVSTNEDGDQANEPSYNASFSSNGKLVAFESDASNLSAADGNGVTDVYVKNLVTDAVTLVSASKTGIAGNAGSAGGSFSADGTEVLFSSHASNLVAHDSNAHEDLFVKDLTTGAIRLVSKNADDIQGNGDSAGGVFSSDGTKIAFVSTSSNLVAGDLNGVADVFVKDLITGDVTLVSTPNLSSAADGSSFHIHWSPDGTQLVFDSLADNLTSDGDSNGALDVFTATIVAPTGGDDQLDGGNGNDTFQPGGGEDTIIGGAGDDVVYFRGQFDSGDQFDGGGGNDTIILEGGYYDAVTLSSGVTGIETLRVLGHNGYNLITADANVDAGAILLVDGSALDPSHFLHFDGSAENDGRFAFIGGASSDILTGGKQSDTFDLTKGGADTVTGGGGSNVYTFGNTFDAADTIAGTGTDTLSLDGNYGGGVVFANTTMTGVSTFALAAGHDYAFAMSTNNLGTDQLTVDARGLGVGHSLTFSAFLQTTTATAFHLMGARGDDFLFGGGGWDTFDLSIGGNDIVHGGGGDDEFDFAGTFSALDTVDGGAGNDVMRLSFLAKPGGSQFVLTGAMLSNVETLQLDDGGQAYNFSTTDTVVAAGQTLTILGWSMSSMLTFNGSNELDGRFEIDLGTAGAVVSGGNGDDLFNLNAGGADTVSGGNGNDTFEIVAADALTAATHLGGGAGLDKLVIDNGNAGTVTLLAAWLLGIEQIVVKGDGFDPNTNLKTVDGDVAAGQTFVIDASASTDGTIFDGSAETNGKFHIVASPLTNTITGGAGDDFVDGSGGDGHQTVFGLAGNDTLIGGFSGDTLVGGTGNDVIQGGTGSDNLTGGVGNDTFKYTEVSDAWDIIITAEHILDFDAKVDKIDLWFTVTGTNSAVTVASLNQATLQGTLATALNAAHLGIHHAVLLTATAGDMAGTYMVVDANGVSGYQANDELLIDITGAVHLSSFSSADFI